MSPAGGETGPGTSFPYGPFHRLESPTQTPETALLQELSGELWGKIPRSGVEPAVQAYAGSLPRGQRGIEFFTVVPPDVPNPRLVRWSAESGRIGIRLDGEFAKIDCVVVKNSQVTG